MDGTPPTQRGAVSIGVIRIKQRDGVAALLVLVLLPTLLTPCLAAEGIHDFHVDITVNADGSMDVVETITVTAEGIQIKRGIYRDFPTRYMGGLVVVPFDVASVQRDGNDEGFFTESQANGVRLYIGRRNHTLPRGEYTYRIHYRTDYQLRHGWTEDELYWNVTGNGWAFPIDRCSATIHLPDTLNLHDPAVTKAKAKANANAIELNGYAGSFGSRSQRGVVSSIDPEANTVRFEYDQQLGPRQGLTVSIIWPAGHVTQKSKLWQLWASPVFWVGVGGTLAVAVYYAIAWVLIGRDPPRGVVYPRYQPPFGFSPATLRYVSRMGYDATCFTVALLGIGAKGALVIDKDINGYTLRRRGGDDPPQLTKPEVAVWKSLLAAHTKLRVDNENHVRFNNATKALKASLKKEQYGHTFWSNTVWMVFGTLASLACFGYLMFAAGFEATSTRLEWIGRDAFGLVFIGALIVIVFGISLLNFIKHRLFTARLWWAWRLVVAVVVACVVGWLTMSTFLGLVAGILLALNLAFAHLIKRPTVLGRELMDMIEGFRMYLATSSRDELRALIPAGTSVRKRDRAEPPTAEEPPLDDIDTFERFLPYAVALDVANEWSQRFEPVLEAASRARGNNRCVSYYHGDIRSNSWTGGSGIGAVTAGMSGAIASASVAPGSSSGGGGGGGSSGGGGGGGGGGGW